MNVPIFVTIIGSHMWGMTHGGSDTDLFVVYAESTNRILAGESTESWETKYPWVDVVTHEIQKVVQQLTKGNYNFVVGLNSPCVVVTSTFHEELKKIFQFELEQAPGAVYESVYAMAMANYKKYIEGNLDNSADRTRKIMRSLFYGINVMENPLEVGQFNIPEMTAYKENKAVNELSDSTRANLVNLMKLYKDRHEKLEPEKTTIDPRNLLNWLVQTRKDLVIAENATDVWRKLTRVNLAGIND